MLCCRDSAVTLIPGGRHSTLLRLVKMFAHAHGFKAHSTNYVLNKINIYYTKTAHCKQETWVSGGLYQSWGNVVTSGSWWGSPIRLTLCSNSGKEKSLYLIIVKVNLLHCFKKCIDVAYIEPYEFLFDMHNNIPLHSVWKFKQKKSHLRKYMEFLVSHSYDIWYISCLGVFTEWNRPNHCDKTNIELFIMISIFFIC